MGGFIIWSSGRFEDFNARLRWSLAQCGLDRIGSLIYRISSGPPYWNASIDTILAFLL